MGLEKDSGLSCETSEQVIKDSKTLSNSFLCKNGLISDTYISRWSPRKCSFELLHPRGFYLQGKTM